MEKNINERTSSSTLHSDLATKWAGQVPTFTAKRPDPFPTLVLGGGLRFNEGKLRHDLINPYAQEGLARVLTKGAVKYAERNWERGMAWSKVIQSLRRHLAAFEAGEDYDPETGELHIDHLQCNAHFLSAYYRIYPQGDDRYEKIRPRAKIGLDIDDVICDWASAWAKKFNLPTPTSWYFDKDIMRRFDDMRATGELDEFYLGLDVLTKPEDLPFEPHCYVTSRPVSTEVTVKWLEKNGFPLRPVITVPLSSSKVETLKNEGVDIFVDDRYQNFEELNRNGICCFLFDAPHNQRYEVGFKRIKSLKELKY